MGKELSERKRKIVRALVETYIATGQPVSSADIQSRYLPEVSSATIRAELSALEALGYIAQPHTSAGRVPLKAAYKLYVGDLDAETEGGALTDAETAFIRSRFEDRLDEVGDLSKRAARIISDVTNYTSFFVSSHTSPVIEEIKLIPLRGGKALVLIVTDAGIIADKTIDVDCELKHEYVESAAELLNKVFCGRSADELAGVDADAEIAEQIGDFRDIFDTVLAIIRSYVAEHSDDLAVEGALKMLDYPEYDVADAQNFLSVISDRGSMSELLEDAEDSIEFSVRIGKEDSGVDKCAIITASYKVGDEVVGRAGVIGPERMDYKKVIGVLDYMKKTLNTVLGADDDKKDGKDEK